MALIPFGQARAILWAQWRSILNYHPRASRGSMAFTAAGGLLWYGSWLILAAGAAVLFGSPSNHQLFPRILEGGLLLMLLYWQVVPIILASSGVSLDLRRLRVFPVPENHLFALEVLLRASVSLEVIVVLSGAGLGLALNPAIPLRGVGGLVLFGAFNLFLSAGIRDLVGRLLARRRVREIVILALVLLAALPQLIALNGVPAPVKKLASIGASPFTPWVAAARIATGDDVLRTWLLLVAWTVAALRFGRWQFERSLGFDEREAAAAPAGRPLPRWQPEILFRWPSMVFGDPLGALVEKDIRFLIRAPRFRLVFLMGFSFGLLVWLPLAFGPGHGSESAFATNYLSFVSAYALLLLGEVTFYNVFGFDRSAAQAYYVLPVSLRTVLAAKNVVALFFVLAEVSIVALVCALVRLPLSPRKLAEAFAVTAVLSVYMLAVGNLSSTHYPRAVDPSQSWRSGGVGRFQAMLLVLYPLLAAPIGMAYLARYAFESEAAFYGVLALSALLGGIVYWVAMDSAVEAAEQRKELILAALSRGQGPLNT